MLNGRCLGSTAQALARSGRLLSPRISLREHSAVQTDRRGPRSAGAVAARVDGPCHLSRLSCLPGFCLQASVQPAKDTTSPTTTTKEQDSPS